jgi:hypothetical protein
MDLADGGNEIDMKRKWNWPIWVGFIITVGGLFSYEFFAQFSGDARFSVGESLVVCCRRIFSCAGSVSGVWQAAALSRQNLWTDFDHTGCIDLWVLFVSDFIRVAPGAALNGSAARWRKSAGIHVAG